MVKNHKLAKVISDVSWSEFIRQNNYKALWHDRIIQKVDAIYLANINTVFGSLGECGNRSGKRLANATI